MKLLLSSAVISCLYASTCSASKSRRSKGTGKNRRLNDLGAAYDEFYAAAAGAKSFAELNLPIRHAVDGGEVSLAQACSVLKSKPFFPAVGALEKRDDKFAGVKKLVGELFSGGHDAILKCLLVHGDMLVARERDIHFIEASIYGRPDLGVGSSLLEDVFKNSRFDYHKNAVFAANNREFLDAMVSYERTILPETAKTNVQDLFRDFERYVRAEGGKGADADADESVRFFYDNGINPEILVQVLVEGYGKGVGEKCIEFILNLEIGDRIIVEPFFKPTLTRKARELCHVGVLARLGHRHRDAVKSIFLEMRPKLFDYPITVDVIRFLEGMGFKYTQGNLLDNLAACVKDKDCNGSLMHKQLTEFGLDEKKFLQGERIGGCDNRHCSALIEHCKLSGYRLILFNNECWKKEEYIKEYYKAFEDFPDNLVNRALENNVAIDFFIENLGNKGVDEQLFLDFAVDHERWSLAEAVHEKYKDLIPDWPSFMTCKHPRILNLFEDKFSIKDRTGAWDWAKRFVMDKREYVEAAIELDKFDCPNQAQFESRCAVEAMSLVLEQCGELILTAELVVNRLEKNDVGIIDVIKRRGEHGLYPKPEFFDGKDVNSYGDLAVKVYNDLGILPRQEFIERMVINGDYRLVRPFKKKNMGWPERGFVLDQLVAKNVDFVWILCREFEYRFVYDREAREIIKNTASDELLQFVFGY